MYDLSEDYLMTYDPNYLEQHSDSSDFDDTSGQIITPRYDYHRVRTKVHNSRSKEEKDFLNQQIFSRRMYNRVCCRSGREQWRTKSVVSRDEVDYQVRQRYHNVKTVTDRADQIDVRQQRTVMRHKLIPCLSSMFRRPSNNVKQMSIIKENQAQNLITDNGNHCDDCGSKIRKFNRRQQWYAAQPVYEARSSMYGSRQANITRSPLTNVRPYKDGYYRDYHLVDSEQEIVQSNNRKKWNKNTSEMKKESSKLHNNDVQQCFSKQARKYPYQIFTTPQQCQTTDVGCLTRNPVSPGASVVGSTSSGFWDYIMDKFNRKSQTDKEDNMQHGCNSCATTPPSGDNNNYGYNIQKESHYKQEPSGESCKCSRTGLKGPTQPVMAVKTVKQQQTNTPKVKCLCAPRIEKKPVPAPLPRYQSSDSAPCNLCHKCQQPHDPTAQAIARKYNGEILCIHNPPCILINGCLNLPDLKQQEQKQFRACPYAKDQNSYYGQTSQYPPPCYDIHQCQIPEYRNEKIIQSVCYHDPPCEVVRTCVKPKYDPTLHNPCIHVPTCERIAECVIDGRHDRFQCPHKPKCLELPICTRNYIMLTATEDVGIQARPGDLVCRHEPPCVLIPKCFARILNDGCIPSDSIPHCVHRPACEMIPACCRKSTKEMTSSSCQGSIVEEKPARHQSKLLHHFMRRSKTK